LHTFQTHEDRALIARAGIITRLLQIPLFTSPPEDFAFVMQISRAALTTL
jgi:hypothetical protein